jgi:hypothetical protein
MRWGLVLVWLVGLLFNLTLIGGAIYIVIHFAAKYWN